MRINTNVASLIAQEANARTNVKLSSSLEKLSSGFKINKASDDASGLAIADKLRTQTTSLKQGLANANSGIALVQIADKSMGEQSNILDTIKAKLSQASTATTSDDGREAILADIQKLITQFDNIANQTNYNGQKLLDGSNFTFQVGETSVDTISTSVTMAATSSNVGDLANNLTAAKVSTTGAASSAAQVDTITYGDGGGTWAVGDVATVQIKKADETKVYEYSVNVTQSMIDNDSTTTVEKAVQAAMVTLINVDTSKHGITAAGSAPAMTLTAGTNDVRYENTSSVGQNISGLSTLGTTALTASVAQSWQSAVDSAITDINKIRSDFGSTQNQLESSVRTTQNQITNISNAESVIRDVDYASESANFNKQNIIAQAGAYAMSQANAVQQNVLRLLQ